MELQMLEEYITKNIHQTKEKNIVQFHDKN